MKRIEHKIIDGVECKRCGTCKQWKPLCEFDKSSCWDGLDNKCKGCKKIYRLTHKEAISAHQKQYNAEHKEERGEYNKQYYIANKEKLLKYSEQYYQENRDKALANKKEYYIKNSERIKDYTRRNKKEFYKNNKEIILNHQKEFRNETIVGRAIMLRHGYIAQDRKYGLIGKELPDDYVTIQDVVRLITKKCAHYNVCGTYGWRKIGLNRLDNSKPHIKNNVESCCPKCNRFLRDRTVDELEFL